MQLICRTCEAWRDVIARPELGERCGSLRICADGHETHTGRWCRDWRTRTFDQRIEDAHDEGRLF